jgi:Tfp pilus assembly protein PilE
MGSLFRDQEGLTVLDAVISLCLIGILICIVFPKFQQVAKEARETAVKAELVNIRRAVALFRILNERNPESLNELIQKDVLFPARIGPNPYSGSFFKQKYLMANAVDAKGNKLDAFGNPFLYDSESGKVRPTTEGYENW